MESLNKGLTLTVSLREFFEAWREMPKQGRNRHLLEYFLNQVDKAIIAEDKERVLREINRVSKVLNRKWTQSGRKLPKFLVRNQTWLDGEAFEINLSTIPTEFEPSTSTHYPGRPRVDDLAGASKKTKIRRIQDLLSSRSVEELTTAAEVAVRKSGQRDAANIIQSVCLSPTRGTKIKKSLNVLQRFQSRSLTNEEALAYFVDSKATVNSYKLTRKYSLRTGNDVFPSYYSVQKAKQDCYPSEEHILVTETTAEIKMQAILDKTANRLITGSKEVFQQNSSSEFTLISKWGGDGSSGHSNYKQRFSVEGLTDEYLFVFSFVPIRIHAHEDNNMILWQNPRPGSTRFCRPIKLIFAKETTELVRTETQKIQNQLDHVVPSVITLNNGKVITIHHKLLLTMVDGKICNILTETLSSQRCFICGCVASEMNNIAVTKTPITENYSFGLSTLHAWIRCFECFLHIAYKLEHKQWRLNASIYADRKKEIQRRFKNEMGLVVDKPKPGFGSSNDGNTARRFFRESEKSAIITGLDADLLKRFYTILRVISSGYEINSDDLEKYLAETKTIYLNLYSWYNMPATVHKLLIHGTEIIKNNIVPIGQLSEEAQEARNKDCRRYRECNTRKTSRPNTNRDLINMLLITSDPLINTFREQHSKKIESLPKEVLALLSQPSIAAASDTSFSAVEFNTESNSGSEIDSSNYDSE